MGRSAEEMVVGDGETPGQEIRKKSGAIKKNLPHCILHFDRGCDIFSSDIISCENTHTLALHLACVCV